MSGTIQWAGGSAGAQNPAAAAGPTQREAQDFSGQLSSLADQMKGLAQELAPATARSPAADSSGAMQAMQTLAQSSPAANAGQGAPARGPEASSSQGASSHGASAADTAQMMQEMLGLMQQLLQMMEGGQGASGQPTAGGKPLSNKTNGPGFPGTTGGAPAPGAAGPQGAGFQDPSSKSAPAGGAASQAAPGEGPQGAGASTGASTGSIEQEMMQMLQTMLSMMQQMASGGAQAA